MEILYLDSDIVVCIKPARVLSTDEPGGLPDLLRQHLGEERADIRTVHRLDRVVSGVMVLARNAKAASELSRQIREDEFQKEYLAVVHGCPGEKKGTLTDLLYRDKARKMTMVTTEMAKGVQEAILDYEVLNRNADLSLVRVNLRTGRTHQIRVQFSSRGLPLVGERKYAVLDDPCEIALWSHKIGFMHPGTGKWMEFSHRPPDSYPWKEVMMRHYDFFQHKQCEYFPCHAGADPDTFSCLFCYCPLYCLGENCGGSFRYTEDGIKDCSNCLKPHRRENYEKICGKMKEVMELARKSEQSFDKA